MLEVDFDRVVTAPADVPFYEGDEAPVRIPPGLAVRCLSEAACVDCADQVRRRGLIAWIALRENPDSPTQWITLCDEHYDRTKRPKPLIFP